MDKRNLRERASTLMDAIGVFLEQGKPQAVFDAYCAAIARYGFDKVVIGKSLGELRSGAFLFHKGVDDFLEIYETESMRFSDPVYMHVMTTHRPFRWREAHVDMSPKQEQQTAIAREHGLSYGYVIPIIDRPGPTGFASIGQAQDFDLDTTAFLEVEMLTRYAYFAIDRAFGPQERVIKTQLSAREVAILLHVSKGKTNWEVGQILGISEYSVRDYLKGLSNKLETSNRTHTVVKAIQLGLILP